jgi:hypothetical protein
MDFVQELPLLMSLFIPLLIYLDLISAVIDEVQQLLDRYQNRQIEYAQPGRGEEEVDELRYEHPRRIKSLLRVTQEQFEKLVEELSSSEIGLTDIPCASVHQQVAIFLFICAQNASYRTTCEVFRHGTATISESFHRVLHALTQLHQKNVRLPLNETPDFIKSDPRFYPYFMDCLGAIDGTYIPIAIKRLMSADQRVPWRCRKGFLAQNVMAAVDFNMNFLFILPGWEGSAHDSRVLKDALEKGFKVPPGRYYLADAGYAASSGLLLTPFKKVRYHLKEWGSVGQKPKNKEELFNLRHASARNVVERTFGVFKARFVILSGKGRDGFSIFTQAKLIYALTALHNFMNIHGANPFDEAIELERTGGLDGDNMTPRPPEEIDDRAMVDRRMEIAEMFWEGRRSRLLRRQPLEDED